MKAYCLHKPDGTKTDISACGVCGNIVRGETNYDISERCCTCYDCGEPLDEHERRFSNLRLYHRKCEEQHRARNEQSRLDKAQLVTDYDGPVYLDGVGRGSYGDGYFADVIELSEHLDFHKGERPEFAFCCKATEVRLDLDSALENLVEEMFEDAYDSLNGIAELQAAVDAFNKANEGVLSWDSDYTRKVAIPGQKET